MRIALTVVSVIPVLAGAGCKSKSAPEAPACTETNQVAVTFGTDTTALAPTFALKNTIAFSSLDRPEPSTRGREVTVAYGNYDLRDTLSPRSTVPYNRPERAGDVAVTLEFHTEQHPGTLDTEVAVYRATPLTPATYPTGFGAPGPHVTVSVVGPAGGAMLTEGSGTVTVATPTRVCGTFSATSTDGTKATGSFNLPVKDSVTDK